MKKFFTCLGATAAYWVFIFIGPAIVMWLNNIGYYFTGGGYGPGLALQTLQHRLLLFGDIGHKNSFGGCKI